MTATQPTKRWEDAYVEYLAKIVVRPGTRADLRSGLRDAPKDAVRVHRYAAPFVSDGATGTSRELSVYTIAAMSGAWPELLGCHDGTTVGGSLGRLGGFESSAWKRLDHLCRLDLDRLVRQLTSTMGLLVSYGSALDMAVLTRDLTTWPSQRPYITRRWIRDFDRINRTTEEPAIPIEDPVVP